MEKGFFADKKREYVITDMFPKRPWLNYMWNDSLIASASQFGFGMSRFRDENGFLWDFMEETDNRLIFIRDNETGEYYAANRNYDGKPFDLFRTYVGQGYTTVTSQYKDIYTELKLLVPVDGMCECWEVTVKNNGNKARSISLYAFADINVGVSRHVSYTETVFDKNLNGIYASQDGYRMPTEVTKVFFAASNKADFYETAKARFKGEYSDIGHPVALANDNLSSLGYCFDNNAAAALQFNLSLDAGAEKKIVFVLGAARNIDEAQACVDKYASEKEFANQLLLIDKNTRAYQDKIIIKTPDAEIDRRVNIWLKRQMDLGKQWGRIYGKGFRDTMQDIESFLPLDPELARKKIIYSIAHQRIDGNPIRMWEPLMTEVYTDGAVWMIFAVNAYLKETNDFSILNEKAAYYDSETEETILEHCIRGVNYLQENLGEHGMCLWLEGDWNDSLNGCGHEGRGETLWLSEAAVMAANELADILVKIGKQQDAAKFRDRAELMKQNILKYGWDKDHFIYGINDYDEKIGSYDSKEGQVFLNPQTWAILSGIVKGEQAKELMDLVERKLGCEYGYTQQYPSYTRGSDHIGRVSYFRPGLYENGSVYNHGVAFKAAADSIICDNNAALDTICRILPSNPANSESGVEPYAMSNMYLGPECLSRRGDAPLSWITGTCGWMFRDVMEGILGICAEYEGLRISPNLPDIWDEVNVIRTFRGCRYSITICGVHRGDKYEIYVDGNKITGNILPVFENFETHNVLVKRV